MTATVFTEARHPGCYIVGEFEDSTGYYSREQVIVALSQTLHAGMVLGKRAVVASVTSSAAAAAGNTGNGVFTIDAVAPVAAGAKNGVYKAVCVAVAANGGTFEVFDPGGVAVGHVAVGATFNNQVKFVIADGATDFIVGDEFDITVGVEYGGDYEFLAHDPAATDGSQVACAVAMYPITTDGVTKGKLTVNDRAVTVRLSDLEFKSGISAANKAAAIGQLQAAGFKFR